MRAVPPGPTFLLCLLSRRRALCGADRTRAGSLDVGRRSAPTRGRRFLLAVVVCGLTAVVPASAIAGTLDQQQTTVAGEANIVGPDIAGANGGFNWAQTFTPALSGGLDRVDLYLSRGAGTSGPLTVEIRDVSGGAPGASVLASASVSAAAVPVGFLAGHFVAVPFVSLAPVLAGGQYAIVAYAGGADQYGWRLTGNVYAGGSSYFGLPSPPTTWDPIGLDLAFKTYVAYPFDGFFGPVDNSPMVNVAKAGSSVPVKFSLGGDRGLGVLAVGYPQSQEFKCDTDAPVDPIEETSTANGGLTYDALTDQYTYVWKTSKSWSGQCRTLSVKLDDNTDPHTASFQFK